MASAPERTKDRLLMLLKTRGALTTKVLAEALGISVPAVRRHLLSLDELVVAETCADGVGRPSQLWRLTAAAQRRFPDTHAELTVRLLDSIEQSLGSAALDKVIADRERATRESYLARLGGTRSIARRVRALAELRSEEGYMASIEKLPDGWLLLENHCPICAAADRCRAFCRNELKLFQEVLGEAVSVERTEYLLGGGSRCAYAIRRVAT